MNFLSRLIAEIVSGMSPRTYSIRDRKLGVKEWGLGHSSFIVARNLIRRRSNMQYVFWLVSGFFGLAFLTFGEIVRGMHKNILCGIVLLAMSIGFFLFNSSNIKESNKE